MVSVSVAEMHCSTMARDAWTHLHVPTIAHEIGSCFGLLHNDALDVNNSSLTGARPDCVLEYDLIAQSLYPLYSRVLNPNNQARVERHFREQETPATLSVDP